MMPFWMEMLPSVDSMSPRIRWNSVVFPAPLGPVITAHGLVTVPVTVRGIPALRGVGLEKGLRENAALAARR